MKRLINKLRWQAWCLYHGCRNLWRFRKVVWQFDACDYAGLMEIIAEAARQMAEFHRSRQHTTDHSRAAHRLRIVAALCTRIADDEYEQIVGFGDPSYKGKTAGQRQRMALHCDYLAQQDMSYLGMLLRRYGRSWWC